MYSPANPLPPGAPPPLVRARLTWRHLIKLRLVALDLGLPGDTLLAIALRQPVPPSMPILPPRPLWVPRGTFTVAFYLPPDDFRAFREAARWSTAASAVRSLIEALPPPSRDPATLPPEWLYVKAPRAVARPELEPGRPPSLRSPRTRSRRHLGKRGRPRKRR